MINLLIRVSHSLKVVAIALASCGSFTFVVRASVLVCLEPKQLGDCRAAQAVVVAVPHCLEGSQLHHTGWADLDLDLPIMWNQVVHRSRLLEQWSLTQMAAES